MEEKIQIDEFIQRLIKMTADFKLFYTNMLAEKGDGEQNGLYPYYAEHTYDEWVEEMLIWDDLDQDDN